MKTFLFFTLGMFMLSDCLAFTNIDPIPAHGFKDFIKWQLHRNKKEWPKSIANPPRQSGPLKQRITAGDEVALSFVGHSTFLIQMQGLNILTDPIWSERCSPLSWIGPKRVREAAIKFEDLPPIDIVLIGHDHYDHMDLPTLKRLQERFHPIFLLGTGNKKFLDSDMKVFELNWWESKTFDQIKITFTPAQHFSGRGLTDRMKNLWGSFLIESNKSFIYFASDTGYGSHFKLIEEKVIRPTGKELKVALLPIGAYEPRWFMKSVHMDPVDAIKAKGDLKASYALAMHYGTFQLTDEGIDEPIKLLQSLNPSNFVVLPFGETFTLD